jgi:ribosomal protein S12
MKIMKIEINKHEVNVIQVAIDHLYDEHTDVLADALRTNDNRQAGQSYHILRAIGDIHAEIEFQLNNPLGVKPLR